MAAGSIGRSNRKGNAMTGLATPWWWILEAMTARTRTVQISAAPGGVPKRPCPRYGSPLCLPARDRIRALQAEGHPITPASIGENPTHPGHRLGCSDAERLSFRGLIGPR